MCLSEKFHERLKEQKTESPIAMEFFMLSPLYHFHSLISRYLQMARNLDVREI